MAISRVRSPLAAAAACLALLALPHVAAARPGTAPRLVQRSGQFVIVHADGRDGTSTHQGTLRDGLAYTPVRAPRDVWIEPGSRVRLEGTMQNGTLVLANSLTAVKQTGPSALRAGAAKFAASPVMHDTAVILFGFAGQPDKSHLTTNPGAAATLAFGDPATTPGSLNAYYREQTYDQIGFSGQVFGPVDIPAPTGTCSSSDFLTWAGQAEFAVGIDDSSFRHYVFVFPDVAACGWSGLAEAPGIHVWINGSFAVPVLAHELGHNLGLYHAGGLTCTSATTTAPVAGSCSIDRPHYQLPQYADPFDAMGNAPVLRQMNMEHKLALGVLPATAVQTVGVSGSYHLAPMETLTGSVELLRLPKPGGGAYFVEYRQGTGFFDGQAAAPAATGVLVHTESPDMSDPFDPFYGDSDTALIDMHPDPGFSSHQWDNAAMSVGQTFDDPARGITIQDVAQDANGATLAITVPIDAQPPGAPGRLAAVVSGTDVALQWTPALDNFGIASYTVARDGVPLGSLVTTTYSDSGLAPGATVTYAVTATDTAGNVGPAATLSVTLPDTLPPSAPASVTAAVGRDGHVRISWTAATDNVGVVSYRVLRDGTGIAQPTGTTYVDATPRPGTGATVTYSVVAFDLVGNASPPGTAPAVRAALLRALGASHLKASRAKRSRLVRVTGTLSDAKAVCRLRLARGAWHPCTVSARGTFSVKVRGARAKQATLLLRDELGRVRQQTLRVP